MTATAPVALVRAARELLGWNQVVLAEKASVHVITIRRYERGEPVQADSINAIIVALNAAGISFLGPESNPASIEGVAINISGPVLKPVRVQAQPPRQPGTNTAPPRAGSKTPAKRPPAKS